MTAVQYSRFHLYCDSPEKHPDPGTSFFAPPVHADVRVVTRARVRQLAARSGWTHVHVPGTARGHDRDYCPAHKPGEGTQP